MSHAIADTPAVPTLPAEVRAALPQARLRGTGVLRFFGLRVYEARLWTAPSFAADDYARQPFGLELVYDRRLEGLAIAERSVAEMRRVGAFDEAQAKRWLALMTQAFPDVAAGDRLLGLHDGQGEVRFFHNGRLTAEVQDADYARLFFGIWLARQTSAPALRESLLGLSR
ncbi:MAG TPA: chalcone isomerase family protein [Roseateles sp.]